MTTLSIEIENANGSVRPATINVGRVLNLGYATRDPAFMELHLAELRDHGINAPVPNPPPLIIPLTTAVLTMQSTVDVQASRTSGEVEFVVARTTEGELVLGLGSDHTDRELEIHNIGWSKQVAPNVLSPRFWSMSDLSPDLDDITMKSWVSDDGENWRPYQDAPARELIRPEQMVAACASKMGIPEDKVLDGAIIFSGTVHAVAGLEYVPYWRVSLDDKRNKRELTLA